MRYVLTSSKLIKYETLVSVTLEELKQVGDIFCDCPTLKPFWHGIQAEIQAAFNLTLPLDYNRFTPRGRYRKEKSSAAAYPPVGGKENNT